MPSRSSVKHNSAKNSIAKRVRSMGKVAALAVALATPVASSVAAQADAGVQSALVAFAQLPDEEKAALENGEVIVSAEREGETGKFVARVLIDASAEDAWQVLTDYDNFEKFLPNVENSELLESDENRRRFEQLNVISVVPAVIEISSRVVIDSVLTPNEQVDFELVEGDLAKLEGVWLLDPVDDGGAEKVLITHRVDIDPGESSPRGLFFSTYRLLLEDSLVAAKVEAERRAAL